MTAVSRRVTLFGTAFAALFTALTAGVLLTMLDGVAWDAPGGPSARWGRRRGVRGDRRAWMRPWHTPPRR